MTELVLGVVVFIVILLIMWPAGCQAPCKYRRRHRTPYRRKMRYVFAMPVGSMPSRSMNDQMAYIRPEGRKPEQPNYTESLWRTSTSHLGETESIIPPRYVENQFRQADPSGPGRNAWLSTQS